MCSQRTCSASRSRADRVSTRTLIDELRAARWFGGKGRAIRSATIVDRACWAADASLRLVEVQYTHGAPETYVLAERFDDPLIGRTVLERFSGKRVPTEAGGSLVFEPTHVLSAVPAARTEPIRQLRGEQSNTSLVFGDALILKLFRRVQFGPNPEVEIGWFLTEHSRFRGMPAVAGVLEYHAPDGAVASLALLQAFQPNRGDAWRTTLERLAVVLDGADWAPSVRTLARLGETTAALHVALAQPGGGHEFDPEPIGGVDLAAWRAAIHAEVAQVAGALSALGITVDRDTLLARADGIDALAGAFKTRHHGDYHLGQVLETPDGEFVIIDFEGEPSKPLGLRREKRSPLRDVAGMLRSFDYARHTALRSGDPSDPPRIERAERWHAAARAAFLDAYLATVRRHAPHLLPADVDAALNALELEKAAYEVLYEINNRPDWLPIPLAALR
jgi:maltose alpha-D-glucosyltransferase / alpha-amylase